MKKLRQAMVIFAFLVMITWVRPVFAGTMYTTDAVRIRKSPSTSATIVTTLARYTKVTTSGSEGDWIRVSYGGDKGYIYGSYLVFTEKDAKAAYKKAHSKTSKKSTKKSSKTTSKKKTTKKIIRKINATDVNFRKKPKGTVITTLRKNQKVTLLAMKNGWSKIKLTSGKVGFVASKYLSKRTEADIRHEQIVAWKKKAVKYCKRHLNDIYSQEKRDEKGYCDCSSLMRDAFQTVTGQYIGVNTDSQTNKMKKYLYKLKKGINSARYGDILYHLSGENENHCGIYIGDGAVINASQTKGHVKVSYFDSDSTYWEYGCRAAAYCYDLKKSEEQ
ncbi:MAG: SH3 domain-containing protein [Eubacteriales bacterium]|nr:SH3 domain-containing protein [Eubacteriales bacterium]